MRENIKEGIYLFWEFDCVPNGFLIEKIVEVDYIKEIFKTRVIHSPPSFTNLIGKIYFNQFNDLKYFKIISEEEVILQKL